MENLTISCVTWNVQTGWPDEDLHQLLGIPRENVIKRTTDDRLPDIYIIGLQEVKSQPQNVVMDTLFEEPWTNSLRSIIGPHDYVRITGERVQGIVTNIFVKRRHVPHVRDIHTAVTRTGFGGLWGNKGASCIRFSIYGCSVCTVNSHLAPHDSGYKERIEHFNTIVDYTSFPIAETSNILFHDYVFWLGDLNFRLDGNLTSEDISKHIEEGNLDKLYEADELTKAQKSGDAFSMLKEGPITFPPTYKFLEGTSEYDLVRRPAWTDRILHQVHVDAYENVKLGVKQSAYSSVDTYTQSDHKPVFSNYSIKVFANHDDRCVHFEPMGTWYIGEGGNVKLTLDSDVVISSWDYLALYKSDFTSTHQYATYMYIPQCGTPPQRSIQFIFNDELLQQPGMYRLAYYSGKYNCYLGLSEPFPVMQRAE